MDQQQFKIRMSVSTKLLLTISALLAIPIFFLNISAINLFRNDKKAYVYEGQGTAAALAGRAFAARLEHNLAILRLIAEATDPLRPLTEQDKISLQTRLDDRPFLIAIDMYALDLASKRPTRLHRIVSQRIKTTGAEIAVLEPSAIPLELPSVEARGFSFINISRTGNPPLLAVVWADLSPQHGAAVKTLIVGYIELDRLLESNSVNRLLVADHNGRVLLHSDKNFSGRHESFAEDALFREAKHAERLAGSKEYISPKGVRTLGSFFKPGLGLCALSLLDYDEAMKPTNTLTEKFVILGLASLGIMLALGLSFSQKMTAPLNRLFKATAQVSAGDFKIDLPVASHDEIGALTASFMAMSHRISDLVQDTADKVRVDQELQIVRTVQQNLFPPPKIENEHLKIFSHYQSAAECGGDWWGCFRAGNKQVLTMTDATGHGLPSALVAAAARASFSVIEKLALDGRFELNPAAMLEVANRVVFDSARGKIMMTAFVAVLDFDTHEITFSSAAQNPPWLFRKGLPGQPPSLTSLVSRGPRLGENQALQGPFEIQRLPFLKDDTIVLYTDGLLDGKDKKGQQYGKKQARRAIEDALHKEPQAVIATVMTSFLAHNAGKKLDDDVTLAVVRILA